ncbi:SDR family oxidoreductase [Marinitenerispora sediminis]|uniref:Short-chain dehydrogenase n=1 Tax=Marinitenerispora sediminis TaxID=1931232 RepID=A0A368T7M6_9ACTN|nr:SDR family oxidoreductase [Marinitenerispora sediminis]RCV51125.1 short-chain dehydrogenase [Marinitenerispora sediminis]RCV58340.1 short-chain dehydrogenase [Marinitenerispora sediminis]RCV60144.1 short-chain dehydrogenase [Marinitenerispora sediminis]
MTDLRFDGRVAVVTGAGQGLGRSHALELAARGAKVVVNDVGGRVDGTAEPAGGEGPAADVVERIRGNGGTAVADTSDVATEDGAQALVDTALEAYGRVDIVVNNAGILRDRSFKNITVAEWDAVVGVHLRGSFLVARAAFCHLREHGYGRIINTASPSGLFGNFGQSNYAAAKMGVVGLTRALAIEGAQYDITANAIAPVAYTRMTEDRFPAEAAERLGPEHVSPLVAWLAHEDCSTTGEVYTVGGGRIARVFVAEGPGVLLPGATAEDILDNWPDINAERPFVIPHSLAEHTEGHLQGLR